MPGFVVNPQRFDPYKNFKFRVRWDGRYVHGVTQVSGLRRRTEKVYRCWPSEYVTLGDLEADESCVAIEVLTLQHEGWERDIEVTEPQEPRLSKPATRKAR